MNRKLFATALHTMLMLVSQSAAHAQAAQGPCAPGISFWKLLDAVSVGYNDGRVRIDKLYAVCLRYLTMEFA